MPAQNRMDRALGRQAKIAVEPAHQKLADSAGAPVRLLLLAADDEAFNLPRELIGVADRPARAVRQGLEAVVLVALEDLVAGLARDAELPADLAHRLAVQKTRDEPQTLLHNRTLLPGHRHLPPGMPGGRCHPCVRYKLSPMSRAAQPSTISIIVRTDAQTPGSLGRICTPTSKIRFADAEEGAAAPGIASIADTPVSERGYASGFMGCPVGLDSPAERAQPRPLPRD